MEFEIGNLAMPFYYKVQPPIRSFKSKVTIVDIKSYSENSSIMARNVF